MSKLDDTTEILDLLYRHGWDERNGGNLSLILTEEEVREITDDLSCKRTYATDFDMTPILGRYFLMTGTGTYFKNMKNRISLVK